MPSPAVVAYDPVPAEAGGDELGDASIATIGEHTSVPASEALDHRPSVVHRIVSIAGAARGGRNDA
jgi:hypothetical protein